MFLMLNLSLAQEKLALTLDQCVETALRNDEEILKAEQTLAEAQAALKVVRSDEYLQLNFTSWYDRAKQNNESETKSYNGTIEAEQLLVRFGELPRRVDAAQEAYRLAELELQSVKIDVASRTRQIFYDIILIQSEIEERRIFRDELQEETGRIDQRVKEKLALEIELLDVQLGLATQELRINELKRELLVKKTELLQIIGADEEAELSISGELPEMQLEMGVCVRTAMDKRTELEDLRG
jgi:outer membrane protein TolC